MRGILRIARTEILEHRRQPGMLFVQVAQYVLFVGFFGLFFVSLETIMGQPDSRELMAQNLEAFGVELDAVLVFAVEALTSLLFMTTPFYVAFLTSYSVQHDRGCGTLPFLMLAPISRVRLLVGKLLGAMAFPLLLHLIFVGAGCLALGSLDVTAHYRDRLGWSAAWWVAYLLGGPATSALVGAVGTVISALSRDARTSIQVTLVVINLISMGTGVVLSRAIAYGAGIQLVYAGGSLLGAWLILLIGARLISRDIGAS